MSTIPTRPPHPAVAAPSPESQGTESIGTLSGCAKTAGAEAEGAEPRDPEIEDPEAEGQTAADDPNPDRHYTIGELAEIFGITTRTIRFYEARGLLSPQRLGANRIYSRRDKARLTLILRGKNLGFSLEDIAEYLALYDADPVQNAQTRLLLDKIETAIGDLQLKRADLDRTLRDLKDIRAKCVDHLKSTKAGG